jgi:DNA transposition AAA+ family ATPase
MGSTAAAGLKDAGISWDAPRVKELQERIQRIVNTRYGGKWLRAEKIFGMSRNKLAQFCRSEYHLSVVAFDSLLNAVQLIEHGLKPNGYTQMIHHETRGDDLMGDGDQLTIVRGFGVHEEPPQMSGAAREIAEQVDAEPLRKIRRIEGFYETRAVKLMFRLLDFTAEEHLITVIVGRTGFSKTESLEEYKRRADERGGNIVLLECSVNHTTHDLVHLIAKAVGVSTASKISDVQQLIIEELKVRPRLLLIDEADVLPVRALETIRYIWDQCRIGRHEHCFGVALVGMPRIFHTIENPRRQGDLQQLRRRMMRATLPPISIEELKTILKSEDWKVEDDAMDFVMRVIVGSFGIFVMMLPHMQRIMRHKRTEIVTKTIATEAWKRCMSS